MFYKRGYVLDSTGVFWEESFTPNDLARMANNNDGRLTYIRANLYLRKNADPQYQIVFVNAETPHYRRKSYPTGQRYGYASECESLAHYACKEGLAIAEKVKIRVDGKDFIIKRDDAITEDESILLGEPYETDCVYTYRCDDKVLQDLTVGNVINFEIHHFSAVRADKMMAYTICGRNILEFDVPMHALPNSIKNETMEVDEAVTFMKNYFENTEVNCISGTFYHPIPSVVDWDGPRGTIAVETTKIDENLSVLIFKDKIITEKNIYKILFLRNGERCFLNDFKKKPLLKFEDAKKVANYLVYMHLSGAMKLEFK